MNSLAISCVHWLDSSRQRLIGAALLLGLALMAARQDSQLRNLRPPWIPPPEEITQSLHPTAARVLSFGHLPVWVDALLVRGLAEAAIEPVAPGTHPALYYWLDLATQLDPLQFELYWFGSNILSIVRRDGTGADLLLDRSHSVIVQSTYPEAGFQKRHWSEAWQLELMRGYNALFELQDFDKAQASFELASRLPGALPFLGPLSRRLSTREGRIEVASRTLTSLLARKNAPEVQAQLEERARELRLARFLFALESEFIASKSRSFESFLMKKGVSGDPEGGKLSWNPARGRIETTSSLGKLAMLYH